MQSFFYPSPIGVLEIKIQNHRLYAVSSSPTGGLGATASCSPRPAPADYRKGAVSFTGKAKSPAQQVQLFLSRYFAGQVAEKVGLPLVVRGSAFQQKVWHCLQTIPHGETRSYSEVAQAVGVPEARRAVGSACATNPFLILVPCHRVVAQKGLGGFALGLPAKQFLLKHEQKFLKREPA